MTNYQRHAARGDPRGRPAFQQALLLALSFSPLASSFAPHRPFIALARHGASSSPLRMSSEGGGGVNIPGAPPQEVRTKEEDDAIQWDLFKKHHAKGSWRGTWTSYDYMGDVVDTSLASVDLNLDDSGDSATHTHTVITTQTVADCETCFDSTDTKILPVASYAPGNLGRGRLASSGMVIGPSLLRTGAMSTELILSHGDGRVRVVFQHAPVWEKGVEPGSCPPQGLKLFRTLVSREALRPGPPTAAAENANPPSRGNPKFFRPVPPFLWHKKWAGTSWTWGPTTGDRGWRIEEVDEADAWHGRPTGDHMGVWSMRLPGGVLVQCPRVVFGGEAGLCRLAWLPEDDGEEGTDSDGDPAKLLRIEASVMALEPIISEEDEDMMVGFYPPMLGSLRCDVTRKVGELENTSMLKKLMELDSGTGVVAPRSEEVPAPPPAAEAKPKPAAKTDSSAKDPAPSKKPEGSKEKKDDNKGEGDSGLDAIRKAIKM